MLMKHCLMFYLCVFSQLIDYKLKWFTLGWTCSNLPFCWTEVILRMSQKHKGPSRSLHVSLNENPVPIAFSRVSKWRTWSTQDVESKNKAGQKVFKNWLFVAVSIVIQASYKHCWKSQSEYPWPSQTLRENTEQSKNHSSHNSSKKTLSWVSMRELSELACVAVVSVFFKTSGASTKDARDKKEQKK